MHWSYPIIIIVAIAVCICLWLDAAKPDWADKLDSAVANWFESRGW